MHKETYGSVRQSIIFSISNDKPMVCRERMKFTHLRKTNLWSSQINGVCSFAKNEPIVHRERRKFCHLRIIKLLFIAKEQNFLICEKQTYSSLWKSESFSITKDKFKNEVQKDFTYKNHSNIMNCVELS